MFEFLFMQQPLKSLFIFGAGDGIRTRDTKLGRLVLYQLSYSRPVPRNILPWGPALEN